MTRRSLVALAVEVRSIAERLPGAGESERADLEARLEDGGVAARRPPS